MDLHEARLFVTRFARNEYAPEEHAAFLKWMKEEASLDDVDLIATDYEALLIDKPLEITEPTEEWVARMEYKLDRFDEQTHNRRRRLFRIRRNWIAAAASVILIGMGTWIYLSLNKGLGPGYLSKNKAQKVLYNTVTTPKGRQFHVKLPDGSEVWMNASTTLRFPVDFAANERNLELTGEAYFEVAKNAAMPFRLRVRDIQIQVLGTRFNAMAFEDETHSRITLTEGTVNVIRGGEKLLLHPGDQAVIANLPNGAPAPIQLIKGVDSRDVLAWKDGYLKFHNDDLPTVMRAIARAYNVEIQYNGGMPGMRFTGTFSLADHITDILKQLESQNIHFKIIQ